MSDDAGEDEDAAQHERAEDAPEQDAELVLAGHGEEREDDRPHEDVVDRQALLDEEPGVVLAAGLAPLPDQEHDAEGEAERDPHRRLDGRFLDGDDVRGAVHEQQIDDEHDDDGADEAEPQPQRDVEAGEVAGAVGGGRLYRRRREGRIHQDLRCPARSWPLPRRQMRRLRARGGCGRRCGRLRS